MSSIAVGTDVISRVVGYVIQKGNFQQVSPNLPQRIAILAEANNLNQSGLDLTPQVMNSARQAGEKYGYGSPIYHIMRILRPVNGDGVGGIPTVVIPQLEAAGATAKIITVTPAGVATANGTHYLTVAGRQFLDGVSYAINILTGDTVAQINAKILTAINAVLGSPFIATGTSYVSTLTSKWKGLTAEGLSVTVDTGNNALGLTYVVASSQAGSGTPSIAGALSQIGNVWYTSVVNSYGTDATTMTALESFNGTPAPDDITPPTGRFVGTIFKPLVAITGSVSDDPSAITDAKTTQVTIAIAPAPLSKGLALEAAANMAYLYALQAQNNPHLDVGGSSYPDMPTPLVIGSMADFANRDIIVKKGCSTVDLVAGVYQVQDFVTTYHPLGENPPQYRYVRNLNLDNNVRYTYLIKEQINVIGKAIAKDSDIVVVDNVIKPKDWKGIVDSMANELVSRALLVDASFMQNSITVAIGVSNPDRFETFFKYKRSGVARVVATTAQAGFNFGTLN